MEPSHSDLPHSDLPHSDLHLTLASSEQGTSVCLTLQRTDGTDPAAETVSLADWPRLEAEALHPLQDFVDVPLPPDQLKEIGSRLAAILLPPPIRAGLEAEMLAETVLLRLKVEHAGLTGVPWEFAYCGEAALGRAPAALSGFLGLHPRLHLIRQTESSLKSWDSAAPPSVDTLRVLIVSSDPNSPGYPALPHLKGETASVSAALNTPECRGIAVTRLDNATPAALARTLRECRPHIVHLIGHGDVRPSGGVLVLQGERDRTAALVYGDELAGWLAQTPVRLVVLSACRTASPVQGLAPSLARAGVPAVVAMQLPLRDAAAGPFARAFYAALAEPQPVEQALAEARRAIAGMGPDWGVPVLYLQMQTGALFAPRAAPAAPAATLPPTNLPYRPSETFVGRDGLLAELHRVLWEEGRSAALVGMSGLGKTQIAVQYAHTQRRAYPGGVFWISGRQIKAELAALAFRFFGAPAQWTTEEAADWACDALTQRIDPALLVCDGFPEDADVRLLPSAGACRLLVTTREGYLVRRGFRAFHLPVLGDDAAWALLQAHSPAEGPEEVLAVRQIASLLGNLPLALALAAHHVHRLGIGFAAYRNRLQAAPFEALEQARRRFVTGTGHDGTFYDALQLSFQSLSPNARQALTTATVFAARGVPVALLGAACGLDSAAVEEAIADLVDSSWVVREEEPRLTLHELIRRFAWERLPEAEQSEVTARVSALLSGCLAEARDAGDWQAVRPELAHCESAARRCRDLSLHAPLLSLLLPLSEYGLTHGELTEARKRCDEGLSLLGQSPSSSQIDAAPFLMFRAEVRQQQGEAAEALEDARAALRGALLSATEGDPALIDYYNVLGIILKRIPQSRREAASCFYRALALSRKAYGRRHPMVAHGLNNLGTLYESLGLYQPALRYLTRALAVTRLAAGAEVPMAAAYLDNIGRVLGLQAKWAEALRCHQESLSINEAAFTRQHPYVASSLYYLAEAEHSLSLPAAAQEHYTEALQLYERFYGPDNYRCGIVRACLARVSEQ